MVVAMLALTAQSLAQVVDSGSKNVLLACTDHNVDCRLDIAFLIDGSESVSPSEFELQRQLLNDLALAIDARGIDAAFAVGEFSREFTLVSSAFDDATTFTQTVVPSIVQSLQVTNTGTAIRDYLPFLQTQKRPGAREVIFLKTDGRVSRRDRPEFAAQVALLEEANIFRVALGLGVPSGTSTDELRAFSGSAMQFYDKVDFTAAFGFISNFTESVLMACPTTTTPTSTPTTTTLPATTSPTTSPTTSGTTTCQIVGTPGLLLVIGVV